MGTRWDAMEKDCSITTVGLIKMINLKENLG